jgi:hypothetical protein
MLMLLFGCGFFFNETTRSLWLREGGVVETISAAGYFITALYILFRGNFKYLKEHFYFFAMLLLFGMRELDFHKRFTSVNLFKSRLYLGDIGSTSERIIGLIIIAIVLYIVFSIVKNHWRLFIANIKTREDIAMGSLAVISLLCFVRIIDGLGRKMFSIGITLNDSWKVHMVDLEEILEMGIPVMLFFLFAVFLERNPENKRQNGAS